jgi:hypothetical protein
VHTNHWRTSRIQVFAKQLYCLVSKYNLIDLAI